MSRQKEHNDLELISTKIIYNVEFSSLYRDDEWSENPTKVPNTGNENLFDELGEDYNKTYCHIVHNEYLEGYKANPNDRKAEDAFAERSVRHFLPCDSRTLADDSLPVMAKLESEMVSKTDSTKFINKDELEFINYDRTTGGFR